MIPYNISDLSLTFFAKGRPWDVPAGHPRFSDVRSLLLDGRHDVDELVKLADERIAILEASQGKLVITDNDELIYGGEVLHGVWVDKILRFKAEAFLFDPIFLALENLQQNPSPEVRRRLPEFVEASKLGFLPDGRLTAYKAVSMEFKDHFSGTVDYSIGTKLPPFERSLVDTDPNTECSTGYHVGSLEYLRKFHWGESRVLLLAFWPSDVLSTPEVQFSNGGTKIRVTTAEVLEEVDKKFADEFRNQNQTVVRGYEAESDFDDEDEDEDEDFFHQNVKVGDWITDNDGHFYKVRSPERDKYERIRAEDLHGLSFVFSDEDVDLYEGVPPVYLRVAEDYGIHLKDDPTLRDGEYVVARIKNLHLTDPEDIGRICVYVHDGAEVEVLNRAVVAIVGDSEAEVDIYATPAHLRANIGDSVKVEGSFWVEDGVYEVTALMNMDDPESIKYRIRIDRGYWIENETIKDVYPG